MLINVQFVYQNWKIIGSLILAVYLCNHFISALVLHYLSKDWRASWYGGALLAQIGELSFVLTASAFSTHIISDFTYQITIAIIALTLLISPFWIAVTKKLIGRW